MLHQQDFKYWDAPNMLLTAINLKSVCGYQHLFKNLSFALGSGEFLLVKGNNGSGKTTLLKILSGLRRPESGQVLWHQRDIQRIGAEYRSQVNWLGHMNGVKDSLTALENLHMMLRLLPQPLKEKHNDKVLKNILEHMGLSGQDHRLSYHFSAGMKRRLALSRLLLSEAPLWILDEPQAALDQDGIKLFEALLTGHLIRGGSAVIASHHEIILDDKPAQHLELTI